MGFEAVDSSNKRTFKAPVNGGDSMPPLTLGAGPPGSNSIPTDNALATFTADPASAFRAALNTFLGTLAYGTGTVTQVNGNSPDGAGHVSLVAADVGAMAAAIAGNTLTPVYALGSNGATVPAGIPSGTLIVEPAPGAAPTLVGSPAYGSQTSTTNITVTKTTSAGSRLMLTLNLTAATTVTDSASNTWTRLDTTTAASPAATGNRIVEIWECVNAAAITSVTITKTAAGQATLYEIRGGSGSSLHNVGSNTSGTTTPAVPLTVSANALMIGGIAHSTVQTATIVAPYVDLAAQSTLSSTENKSASYQPTSGGTYGPTWTYPTAGTKATWAYAVNP